MKEQQQSDLTIAGQSEAPMAGEAEDLLAEIASITARLKGYGLSQSERLVLNSERHELRARYNLITGAPS